MEGVIWTGAEFEKEFATIPELASLTDTPFMLEIVTDILQHLKNSQRPPNEVKSQLAMTLDEETAEIAWALLRAKASESEQRNDEETSDESSTTPLWRLLRTIEQGLEDTASVTERHSAGKMVHEIAWDVCRKNFTMQDASMLWKQPQNSNSGKGKGKGKGKGGKKDLGKNDDGQGGGGKDHKGKGGGGGKGKHKGGRGVEADLKQEDLWTRLQLSEKDPTNLLEELLSLTETDSDSDDDEATDVVPSDTDRAAMLGYVVAYDTQSICDLEPDQRASLLDSLPINLQRLALSCVMPIIERELRLALRRRPTTRSQVSDTDLTPIRRLSGTRSGVWHVVRHVGGTRRGEGLRATNGILPNPNPNPDPNPNPNPNPNPRSQGNERDSRTLR